MAVLGGGVLVTAATTVSYPAIATLLGKPQVLPKIDYGVRACAWCHMLISDDRFASAYWSSSAGDWKQFDSVGCSFASSVNIDTLSGIDGERMFVSDYSERALTKAQTAYYVAASPELLWTPMNWGIVAFSGREAALTLAEKYGVQVLGFAELLSRFETNRVAAP